LAASDRYPGGSPKGASAVLVAELAAGTPAAEAARRAGMSERTARRRMEDPATRSLVNSARERLLDAHLGRLTALTSVALDTLDALLRCQNDPTRLGAAKAILEHRVRLEERQALGARIAALESALSAGLAHASPRPIQGGVPS
jgi:hypothetical protein